MLTSGGYTGHHQPTLGYAGPTQHHGCLVTSAQAAMLVPVTCLHGAMCSQLCVQWQQLLLLDSAVHNCTKSVLTLPIQPIRSSLSGWARPSVHLQTACLQPSPPAMPVLQQFT